MSQNELHQMMLLTWLTWCKHNQSCSLHTNSVFFFSFYFLHQFLMLISSDIVVQCLFPEQHVSVKRILFLTNVPKLEPLQLPYSLLLWFFSLFLVGSDQVILFMWYLYSICLFLFLQSSLQVLIFFLLLFSHTGNLFILSYHLNSHLELSQAIWSFSPDNPFFLPFNMYTKVPVIQLP